MKRKVEKKIQKVTDIKKSEETNARQSQNDREREREIEIEKAIKERRTKEKRAEKEISWKEREMDERERGRLWEQKRGREREMK